MSETTRFYSIQKFREFYFPRQVAEERERKLRENPKEWARQKAKEAIERVWRKQ